MASYTCTGMRWDRDCSCALTHCRSTRDRLAGGTSDHDRYCCNVQEAYMLELKAPAMPGQSWGGKAREHEQGHECGRAEPEAHLASVHKPGGLARVMLLHLLHAVHAQRVRLGGIALRRVLDRGLRRLLHARTASLSAAPLSTCRWQLAPAQRGLLSEGRLSTVAGQHTPASCSPLACGSRASTATAGLASSDTRGGIATEQQRSGRQFSRSLSARCCCC